MNIKICKNFIIVLGTLLGFLSCKEKKVDQVFLVFNEGVTLNLNSIEAQDKGDFEKAALLNKLSIDKFRETFKLDSTHAAVRSALGHSLYIDKQFREAISWFDQANKVNGDAAINFREMGLCKINLGQIPDGKSDIDKAFSMDTTKEIRELTIQDLVDMGEQAFLYGDGYVDQGEPEKGKDYKVFSIGVLMLAFEYDKTKKDIALKVAEFADKLNDRETAKQYGAFGGK